MIPLTPKIVRDWQDDPVEHPAHYRNVPDIECIEVAQWFSFTLGNVIKYIWRADEKGNAIEDLKKARFYLDREIRRREEDNLLHDPAGTAGQRKASRSRDCPPEPSYR